MACLFLNEKKILSWRQHVALCEIMLGFTLLEALLALFILSFGLLGIAGMQLAGLEQSQDSYFESVAAVQLFSLQERLRVNKSQEAKNQELEYWNMSNARLLPRGKGNYQCQQKFCTLRIFWQTKKEYFLSFVTYGIS